MTLINNIGKSRLTAKGGLWRPGFSTTACILPYTQPRNVNAWHEAAAISAVATVTGVLGMGGGIEVHSSVKGKSLLYIDRFLVPTPQARADKIAQLRRAVESGSHSVSAEQIAEKMLREALVETLTRDRR